MSPLYGALSIRALSTLLQNPAATAAPLQRQTSVCSLLDLPKIRGYERTSRLSGTQVFPRWFSAGASSMQQMQENASTKVTAFSPLEATITKTQARSIDT